MKEGLRSNTRDAIRNSDGGKTATIESTPSNARYAVGDGGILATNNKSIGSSFDNSITILTTIVVGVSIFHYNRSKPRAPRKSLISNARDAIRDGNRGEGGATIESKISNALYAIGDSKGGQGGTAREGLQSNARYAGSDADRGKGSTACKSKISNILHTIRDENGD